MVELSIPLLEELPIDRQAFLLPREEVTVFKIHVKSVLVDSCSEIAPLVIVHMLPLSQNAILPPRTSLNEIRRASTRSVAR